MERETAGGPRWLLRFGYDGVDFAGWARQPGLPTVEGLLLDQFRRRGIIEGVPPAHLDVASRTDRGVSARANALAIFSPIPPEALLRRLNAISSRIWFSAVAPISAEFNVRHATRRTYRYFDPVPFRSPARVRLAASVLRGPLDARSFGRGVPLEGPQPRPVESVTIRRAGEGRVIEVRAPSFVWGMVRKIVGALHLVDEGRLPLETLRRAARGEQRLTLPLAPAPPLVLWDVEFPLTWTRRWTGPTRHQARDWEERRREQWARTQVLDALRAP